MAIARRARQPRFDLGRRPPLLRRAATMRCVAYGSRLTMLGALAEATTASRIRPAGAVHAVSQPGHDRVDGQHARGDQRRSLRPRAGRRLASARVRWLRLRVRAQGQRLRGLARGDGSAPARRQGRLRRRMGQSATRSFARTGPRPDGPPILIAGTRPRMMRLTAKWADRWNSVWYGLPTDEFRDERAAPARGMRGSGRDPDHDRGQRRHRDQGPADNRSQ